MRIQLAKIALAASVMLAAAFTFTACSNDDSGGGNSVSSSSLISVLNKYVAEPDKESIGNDRIKYSYSYGGYDFYYIYLGKMKHIPLFSHPAQHHNGMSSAYTVEITETIKNSTTETITNSIETTKSVIDENTKTVDIKASQEIKASFPIKIVKAEVKVAAEEHWNYYTKNSTEFRETTSLTSTVTTGTEYTKTTMQSRTWNFTSSNNVGYYRYTLFSSSDVYLYVAKDSKTGEIDYEFREYIVPDTYFWQLDYSETSSFAKSDSTGFEFDVSMLNSLPKPTLALSEEKTLTKEFTVAGNHAYTFDEGFPATIEIYALGAGGGGQGGHSKTALVGWNGSGTGGGGGSGGTAYWKFDVTEPAEFEITVGGGGASGNSVHKATGSNEVPGENGSNGGNTTVTWVRSSGGNIVLAAEGGKGGGCYVDLSNDPAKNWGNSNCGGYGGEAYLNPSIATISKMPGKEGGNGSRTESTSAIGGKVEAMKTGSVELFPLNVRSGVGGNGGYGTADKNGNNHRASTGGGNGEVLIVVTYEEQ
jgi:hypothetical protein